MGKAHGKREFSMSVFIRGKQGDFPLWERSDGSMPNSGSDKIYDY
jgi:hypothetical protein